LAHLGHPLLPGLVADQGNPVDLGAMGSGELDVVPQGMQVPALEIVELGQDADLAVLGDLGIDQRDELLVVLVVELARQLETHRVGGEPRENLDHGITSVYQRTHTEGDGRAPPSSWADGRAGQQSDLPHNYLPERGRYWLACCKLLCKCRLPAGGQPTAPPP